MLKTFTILALWIAALAAALGFEIPQSRAAAGDEPWCILDDEGRSHCQYSSPQQCLQEIANGNRGFCTQNPWGSAAAAAPPQRSRRNK